MQQVNIYDITQQHHSSITPHFLQFQGGIFCYMEHTRSDTQPMRLYQELMTPIFSRLLNGCHYNRQPQKVIMNSDIYSESFYTSVTAHCLPYYHAERTQVWGRAIKWYHSCLCWENRMRRVSETVSRQYKQTEINHICRLREIYFSYCNRVLSFSHVPYIRTCMESL